MSNARELTDISEHFAFGRNWAAYAEKITDAEIDEAVAGLSRLLGGQSIQGKRFLDIGCGSGLHALAALRLGAREVVAVDLDPDSVQTARSVLTRHTPDASWSVHERSVFDLSPAGEGNFDVVYSWGVLHHTGDMYRAMHCAAQMVAPGGTFIFALYRKTWMCNAWTHEKRWYTKASPKAQERARALYVRLYAFGLRLKGRSLAERIRGYRSNRGMDFYHDVHDWMGGYPYESILPHEVAELMTKLGFSEVAAFARDGKWFGRSLGLFGSGCDEYVYSKD